MVDDLAAIIERNNVLTERLIGLLEPVPLPLDLRPRLGNMTMDLQTVNPMGFLRVRAESTVAGLSVLLVPNGQHVIAQHSWNWSPT